MSKRIVRVRIDAFLLRGFSSITFFDGGSDANAIAAKVSIIKLIHNICVTVSGDSVPISAPARTRKQAVTFTVSWKSRNL